MEIILFEIFILFVLISMIAVLSKEFWIKLRDVHERLHSYEKRLLDLEKNITFISRAACRLEARTNLGRATNDLHFHAQHGEELFLWEKFNFKPNGVFVEVGAYDGVSLSNSMFFEKIGWRGLLVEAHPTLANKCRLARPEAITVHAALGEVDNEKVTFSMVQGKIGLDTLSFVSAPERHRKRIEAEGGVIELVDVPTRTLNSVLAEHEFPSIDWMSIDVEGAELEVLKGANLSVHQPKVLMIEDNSGGKDASVAEYLNEFGYSRERTIGCNDIYIKVS